jgi:hypothetical protein
MPRSGCNTIKHASGFNNVCGFSVHMGGGVITEINISWFRFIVSIKAPLSVFYLYDSRIQHKAVKAMRQ